MKYTLTNVTRQTGNFGPTITCQAVGEDNSTIPKCTIYKNQKDGTFFPFFDNIQENSNIDANAWTNPKGYVSLFPPRPAGDTPKRGAAGINKAMERKEQSIGKFQESKEEGIKISGTMRDAVSIVVSMNAKGDLKPEAIREAITKWRKWLWEQWDAPLSYPTKVGETDVDYPTSIDVNEIPF